eukprot:TRINITY_DN10593_c0_g1_i1.p1 TRINITY_DN10593_c0_g1~~TRINITY_DN10593_c0_g1_i1.p1  ORF type:complete len:231 (-),score=64.50 TRINITY_DN10593_c0_g1_i1:71-763(-)
MSDKAKKKAAKISDKEAEKMILKYLQTQNRPYNSQTLFDNLHGAVGKTQVGKVMGDMADRNVIASKEFGKQKLFWRSQEEDGEFDSSTLQKLDKEIEDLEAEKAKLMEENQHIQSEVKKLTSLPTDEQADSRISALKKENESLATRLEKITGNKVVISTEEKKKTEKEYNNTKQLWRKRKRSCMDICSHMGESSEKKFKQIKEEFSLETDEDYNISIDNDTTTKLKKGEV